MNKDKFIGLFWEIFRFGIVGTLCFVVDSFIVYLINNLIFEQPTKGGNAYILFWATAIGFAVSVVLNYMLSRCFVFNTNQQKEKGKGAKVFIIFVAISVIGLFLTEFFMWLFNIVFLLHILLAKAISALLVMIWNYLGRKLLIFK